MIPLSQGKIQRVVFNRATIQENELLCAGGAADPRLADEPSNRQPARVKLLDLQQLRCERRPTKVPNPLQQIGGRRELVDHPLVIDEDEADLRMPNGLQVKLMLHMAGLCVLRAQKFPSCGQIVEKR